MGMRYKDFVFGAVEKLKLKQDNQNHKFDYEVYNENGELLNVGNTVLAFVNTKTKKPEEGPRAFIDEIKKRI